MNLKRNLYFILDRMGSRFISLFILRIKTYIYICYYETRQNRYIHVCSETSYTYFTSYSCTPIFFRFSLQREFVPLFQTTQTPKLHLQLFIPRIPQRNRSPFAHTHTLIHPTSSQPKYHTNLFFVYTFCLADLSLFRPPSTRWTV